MGLTIVAASADTTALAADVAAAKATAKAAHDVAVKAEQDAKGADDRAANARQMVLNRDPRLTNLEDVASRFATEIARTDRVHADLQAGIDQALARAMTPGPAGPAGPAGASVKGEPGKDGAAGAPGPAGTANLAVSLRPIGALALGGNMTVVLPLSHTMPSADYRVEFAHSAVIALANVTYTSIVKTTTTVTVKVTSVGLALVAGTLLVVAI